MIRTRLSLALVSLVFVGSVACGDGSSDEAATDASGESTASSESSTSGETSGTGETGTSDEGGETGGAGQVLEIRGVLSIGAGTAALADADVCWIEGDVVGPCTTTTTGGSFQLEGVPVNTQGAVRVLSDLSAPYAEILRTGDTDIFGFNFGMDTQESLAGYFMQAGVEPVSGTVTVMSQLRDVDATGHNLVLAPASGDGPHYWGFDAAVNPTATSTGGTGVGMWFNVVRGDGPFDLSFEKDSVTCATPRYGLGPLDSWPVPAGVDIAFVTLECE